MTTSQEPLPGFHRPIRPKLDGADPLLGIVVREVAVRPHHVIARQGDALRTAHLLVGGLACHHRLLSNGRRQITALLVPGDMCDLDAVFLGQAHCFVETLTPCVLGEIPEAALDDADGRTPELRRALRRQLLRQEAISREWMVGMGRRNAKARLAHLLCELRERLSQVGVSDGDSFELALTQLNFADVLGMSPVHMNRMLQDLRAEALIEFKDKVLHIVDHAALVDLADFDPSYLRST